MGDDSRVLARHSSKARQTLRASTRLGKAPRGRQCDRAICVGMFATRYIAMQTEIELLSLGVLSDIVETPKSYCSDMISTGIKVDGE